MRRGLRGLTAIPESAKLKFSHFLFEISNVLAAIPDICVHSLLHQGVVGRLPHVGGGIYQSLFSLDLSVDRGDKLVVVHFEGFARWGRTARTAISQSPSGPFLPLRFRDVAVCEELEGRKEERGHCHKDRRPESILRQRRFALRPQIQRHVATPLLLT